MTHKKEIALAGFILTIFLTSLLVWALLPVSVVQADLPSRNPSPSSKGKEKSSGPIGTYIELSASGTPGVWSVVQWQNELGDWYDVEGWQGALDATGSRRWWVHEKDFGDGLFRWVVMQSPGGTVLGTSQPFNLPAGASEVGLITIK